MAKQKPTQTIEVIPSENEITIFTDTIQNSGLEKTKAEKYALGYAPLMREVIEQSDLLKGLDKTKAEDAVKAKRVSLDLGKICSRLTTKKKEDKDTLLIETRLIDGLFNVAESTARLTQKEADEIVDYLANIERERLSALAYTRRAELESFGADTSYLPLDIMGDEQYARCLESAQLAFEARKVAAEKLEAERLAEIERVRLAEIEAARIGAERIEAERLEAIRIRDELQRVEDEKKAELAAKKERAEQYVNLLIANGFTEDSSGEAWSKGGSWTIKWEKLLYLTDGEFEDEVNRVNEWNEDRKAKEIAERQHAAELKKQSDLAEKLARQNEAKLKAETERLEKVAAQQLAEKQKQQDRQNALWALGLIWDGQMFHYRDINFHWTDLLCMDDATFDKNLKGATRRMEVLKAEQAEKERAAKAESERIEKKLREMAEAEAKEIDAKNRAMTGPDKDKINALYLSLKTLDIPDFTSIECQIIGTQVLNKISHILSYIKEESKKLS